MARVFLGLGSNIERERYLVAGLDALTQRFGELLLSSVYDCPAIGFEGQPFLNMVVALETGLRVGELARQLRHIECEYGRAPDAARFSARQLDIDILLYDELSGEVEGVSLPRAEILQNAFVLRPLAELWPAGRHPLSGLTYAEHWRDYGPSRQVTRRIDFDWRGRSISRAE